MVEYEEMTVAQLKDVLRERELPVSGKKAELIARLQEADDAAEEEFSDEVDEEFTDEVDEDFDEDDEFFDDEWDDFHVCLLYTSPSPRDATLSRMPSSA